MAANLRTPSHDVAHNEQLVSLSGSFVARRGRDRAHEAHGNTHARTPAWLAENGPAARKRPASNQQPSTARAPFRSEATLLSRPRNPACHRPTPPSRERKRLPTGADASAWLRRGRSNMDVAAPPPGTVATWWNSVAREPTPKDTTPALTKWR